MTHEEIKTLIMYGKLLRDWDDNHLLDFFETTADIFKFDEYRKNGLKDLSKEELIHLKETLLAEIIKKGNEYIDELRKNGEN